jgi:hypothetical protein
MVVVDDVSQPDSDWSKEAAPRSAWSILVTLPTSNGSG